MRTKYAGGIKKMVYVKIEKKSINPVVWKDLESESNENIKEFIIDTYFQKITAYYENGGYDDFDYKNTLSDLGIEVY